MSMQDPIADMLTRIRNAQMIGIEVIQMPYSNFKESVLNVMQNEGYIAEYKKVVDGTHTNLQVALKYYQGRPVIQKLTRISKPSLRVYKRSAELPTVRGGLGLAIVSTSKGVMSCKSAKRHNLGGEILCTVE